MLSATQLQRLLTGGQPAIAIERILSNGRRTAPSIRQRVARPEVMEIAAPALVVQRACELLYQPQAWLERAAIGLQQWVQAWIRRSDPANAVKADDLVAAALALRALAAWEDLRRFQPGHGGGHDHGFALGVERLAEAVRDARAAGRLSASDAAAVRWQMRDRAAFHPVLAAMEGRRSETRGGTAARAA